MARLVITHSTYIEGLLKKLKKLAKHKGIKTITPAVLSKTKGKRDKLEIRVSTKILGGYKLIARKGKMTQEVYLVTREEESVIEDMIKNSNPKNIL